MSETVTSVFLGMGYDPSTEPIAAFTRVNGTFTIDVIPENTTVPLIDETEQRINTYARNLTQKYFKAGDWRPEVDLNSKLQQAPLVLAMSRIYYLIPAWKARNQARFEVWGNETLGLLGTILLDVKA